MLITSLRWITFAAYLSLLLVYFKGGTSIFEDIQKSIKSTQSYQSTILILLMLVCGLFLIAGQLLICLGRATTYASLEKGWIVALGAILNLLSTAAVYWFRFSFLKRFWSASVKVDSAQKMIQAGPYGIVRHPLYAMALIMYPGIALVFATWWIWLACGFMVLGYVLVTAYEDRVMATHLADYEHYQQRTPYRLVPGLW